MHNFKYEKQKHHVIIYTSCFKIEGIVHVSPGDRITDFMCSSNGSKFIPMTNVSISRLENMGVLQKTEYLCINKEEIMCVLPKSNLLKKDYQKEFYNVN